MGLALTLPRHFSLTSVGNLATPLSLRPHEQLPAYPPHSPAPVSSTFDTHTRWSMHLAWVARARSVLTLRPMGGRVTLPPREEGPLLPLSLQTYLTESVYKSFC
jgi:hypothetical protein